MRWIEIDITRPDETAGELLQAARDRQDELPRLQADLGLDSPMVARFLEEQGQLLFKAVQSGSPEAFAVDFDGPHGYHLIVDQADLTLPWNCLHNGLRFLLEDAPVCASPWSLEDTGTARPHPWLNRWRQTRFTEGVLGEADAAEVARHYRPEDSSEPEILFVNGRVDGPGRARAREESAQLDNALEKTCDGIRLARLDTPEHPPTPSGLVRRGRSYQAFHYSDVTHREPIRPESDHIDIDPWTGDGGHPGGDLEVVGVDPVTSILDEVSDRSARDLPPSWAPRPAAEAVALASPAWEFEDGPLRPEDLQRHHAAPPFVFSNSWLSLPGLGSRFLQAGTSTFVGTQALVANRDARSHCADIYQALSAGLGAAEAIREAALGARERLGPDHPLWLSYGVVGMGPLALQYL